MRQFVPNSPFAAQLGIELIDVGDDGARLRLPWRPEHATVGDVVHGGAISTLADMAVMASAWATDDVPADLRGVTVSLTVNFLDAARAEDLEARGRVVRRGRSLTCCEADVLGADGRIVARALGTYKVG